MAFADLKKLFGAKLVFFLSSQINTAGPLEAKAEVVRSETPPPQAWLKCCLSRPPAWSGIGRVHPISQAGRCEGSPGCRRGSRAFPSGSALCAAGSEPPEPRESRCPRLWKSTPLLFIPLMARGSKRSCPTPFAIVYSVSSPKGCLDPYTLWPPHGWFLRTARLPRAPRWLCAHKSAQQRERRIHCCVFLSSSRRPHRRCLCS